MLQDGNGWSAGPNGTRCWGRFGAAGLLLFTPDARVLMQHRADWTSCPLTWGVPGGARDSHESAEQAALRESEEETGVRADQVQVLHAEVTAGPYPADPQRPDLAGGWTYTTVFAMADTPVRTDANAESLALEWVPADEIPELDLLPAFRDSWPRLRQVIFDLIAQRG
ncbi:NUDIX hydrolase [Corynebacterium sp. TAE3-ERU12]|uniref:NUDIX hydrolase n=1 Tax=Corynebacterium sp. TAE3-ERU12 TaxID=2849491 RepID=UPI001C477221|nr:NUDIX hydrolase [Corynebacterium sp. TAE3-ERU12]MBV7295972.1 NUDIX hydrolase [Corynebacterium sp. TAE3-ERU12]